MNATMPRLAVVLCTALSAPLAHAQYYQAPFLPPQARYMAPDACGPGYYLVCPDGQITGPHYYVRPPFEPFNGMLPPLKGSPNQQPMQPSQALPGMPGLMGIQGKTPPMPAAPMLPARQGLFTPRPPAQVVFPTHPYARSPRDFFMWNDAQEERHTRERRPVFVP